MITLTIYVVDMRRLPTVRAVRDEFIDTSKPPTSSLVQVAGLVAPDRLIEVDACAAVAINVEPDPTERKLL